LKHYVRLLLASDEIYLVDGFFSSLVLVFLGFFFGLSAKLLTVCGEQSRVEGR